MAECLVNNKNLIPYEDSMTFDRFEYKQAVQVEEGVVGIDFRELNLISQRWYLIDLGGYYRNIRLIYGESKPPFRVQFWYLAPPSTLGTGVGKGTFNCVRFDTASYALPSSESLYLLLGFYLMETRP